MGEPAIRRRAVPVLHTHRDIHHIPRMKRLRRLSGFLIKPTACHADQNLPAAALRMMDMPVVAAPRLEGHIVNAHLCRGDRRKVTLPNEILCKGIVGRTDGENHPAFVCGLRIIGNIVLRPHFFCHAERRPRLGPTGIKRRMGQDLRDLRFGHTVVLCGLQVILKRGIRQSLRQ